MSDSGWDKVLTKQLVALGIGWDKARVVVGIIAEQRQIADNQGYVRGFKDGYLIAQTKYEGRK